MESWLLNYHKGALGKVLPLVFYFILWEIWKKRCSKVYREENTPVQIVISAVAQNLKFGCKVMHLKQDNNDDGILRAAGICPNLERSRVKKAILIRWCFPDYGTYKLNCDGSSLGNPGPSGGGFVVRNYAGQVLLAGWKAYGEGTNMKAEILAMLNGVSLSLQNNLSPLQVETDSKVLYDVIHGKAVVPWKFMVEIQAPKAILAQHSITVTHIYREANAVADHLAKKASQLQTTFLFDCTHLDPITGLLIHRDNLQIPGIRLQA